MNGSTIIAPPLTDRQPDRRTGIRAGLLLGVVTLFLAPAAALPTYWATILIGMGGFAGLLGSLYYKYRRPRLNIETVFLVCMGIELLLAPAILCLVSDNFTASWFVENVEHHMVKPAYPAALLMVLVYGVVFLITSGFVPERPSRRLWDGKLDTLFTKRNYIIIGTLLLQLWVVRYLILKNGYFYYNSYSAFGVEDYRIPAWSQINSGLGPIVLAFLWIAALTRNLPLLLVLCYTFVEFTWNFLAGGREGTLIVVAMVILMSAVYRNRTPWKLIIPLIVIGSLLIGYMNNFRDIIRQNSSRASISLAAVTQSIMQSFNLSKSQGVGGTLSITLSRIDELDDVAAIYAGVPSRVPFLNGETYGRIPDAFIPRFLWHDKPAVNQVINEWFFVPHIGQRGGSMPITTMGEGYLNFGWLGVILAACASSLVLRFSERFVTNRLYNAAMLAVYVGMIGMYARFYTQPMTMWLPGTVKILFFAWLIHTLTWIGMKAPQLPDEENVGAPEEQLADPLRY